MNTNKLTLIAGMLLLLTSIFTNAQDGHYWSENYGNKSMLLSGTVNASVEDLGAVFYNPGRLGQIENPAFVISAKVYEWSTIKIENGINEGVDLTKSSFGGAPSLVAGTFTLPFLKNHKFAYAFLTRKRTKADFFIREEDEGDLVHSIPGNEIFNGKLNFVSNSGDEWMGLTWSPPISKNFSLGLSNFYAVSNKSSSIALDMNALGEDNQVAKLSINRQYSYNTNGLIWKLGAAWDLQPIRLGLTITTPRVNLKGNGSFLFEDYLVGVDTSGDGNNDDVYIFNLQNELQAKYKLPWAIGLGVGIHFKKAIIHLSAEWYDKVPRYTILEPEPFVGQSTGEMLGFTLYEELDPVLNYGIGLEWKLNEKITFYGSFATDHSGVPSNITRFAELKEEAVNSVFQADFYRLGGGMSLNTKWVEITLGATRIGASQQFDRPINFPDEGNDPIFESDKQSTLKFSRWQFILGFSFPFVEKVKKSLDVDLYL